MVEIIDQATEQRRLSEHYRQMTDGELVALARKTSELTDIAQDALAGEISCRKLKVEPEEPPPARIPDPPNPVYEEDRQLVVLATVWSLRDAFQLQMLLDRAGIPFVMGTEKATSADAVTSNFSEGVDVGVMRVAFPWVRDMMRNYSPKDEPAPKPGDEYRDFSIKCPKCHSKDVVFRNMIDEDPITHQRCVQRFEWKCDSCGNEWEDDGISK